MANSEELLQLLRQGVEFMNGFAKEAGVGKIPAAKFCYEAGTWTGQALKAISELDAVVSAERFRD